MWAGEKKKKKSCSLPSPLLASSSPLHGIVSHLSLLLLLLLLLLWPQGLCEQRGRGRRAEKLGGTKKIDHNNQGAINVQARRPSTRKKAWVPLGSMGRLA
jgi:hypothetical protein